jgi:transcriptional regulator with XRE-family HTH domain
MDAESERAKMLGKLIADWRRDKGLSRPETLTELAKQGVELSYSHLQKMEKGERSLASASVEIREGLRHLFGITHSEWTAKTGLYTPERSVFFDQVTLKNPNLRHGTRSIPKYDFVGMGPGGRDGRIIGYVDIPDTWNGEFVSFDAMGDSMAPQIPDGTTLIIRLQDYSDVGEVIVCWTPEDGMLCKHLKDVLEDGIYLLTSFNPAYPPIWARDIKIYGILWETRSSWRKNGKKFNGNY